MKNWIISGLLLLAFFAVYEGVASFAVRKAGARFARFPLPNTKPLVDSAGEEYYQHISPVSAKEKTYLMVVSYTQGFDETQERFKIYYVWYKSPDDEPLRVEVYAEPGSRRASSQVCLYRKSRADKCPITVLFPSAKDPDEPNYPTKTWLFTPPKVFPSELVESDVEREGFRQYHEWIPPFEQ